jgi:methyl-accepting chemotaxis protein
MDKVEDVLEKLATLEGGINDRHNSTKDILANLSQFADSGLDEVVTALEEIRDEIEEAENRIEELKQQVEEINA